MGCETWKNSETFSEGRGVVNSRFRGTLEKRHATHQNMKEHARNMKKCEENECVENWEKYEERPGSWKISELPL